MAGTNISAFATHRALAVTKATIPLVDAKSSVDPAKAQSLPTLVSLAADLAQQGPPVDYAKIAQIRQAIASGTYEIDFRATAAAILGYDRLDRDGF